MLGWDRHRLAAVAASLALLGASLSTAAPSAVAEEFDPCDVRGASRIVAIGDVHGAYDNMVAVLQSAGVIDKKKRWSGGTTHLVQTGDVLDRGDKEREVMDLLMKLEKQARKAGGRVHALLGNHEIQNFLGLFGAVAPKGFEAFRSRQSREIRDWYYELARNNARSQAKAADEEFDAAAFRTEFEKDVVLGYVERLDAIGPKGRYGRWLRGHPTVTMIDGVVFLHGGISPAVAELSCSAVNRTVVADLGENLQATRQDPLNSLTARPDGPLWYRGLAREDEATFLPDLERILELWGARAIVVGHTPTGTGKILSRFDGRVYQIDVGMHRYYGGNMAALEITGEGVFAIYPDQRVMLHTWPEGRAAAH